MSFDDRDDPFDDLFEEIDRMMNSMAGGNSAGFGEDTHVDVHADEETVRLVADLPGLDKDDLDLQCDGETLTIRAQGDSREYTERVRLPARVDEHSATATFNNGVLEVSFDRLEDSAAIDVE